MNSAQTLGRLASSLRFACSSFWKMEASFKGVTLGNNVVLVGRPMISVASDSTLFLSDGVRVVSAERSNPLGCSQPSVLRTMAPKAKLVLGPAVGISATVICAGREITIGENTIIGSGAMILDNDFHERRPDGTWDDVFDRNARPIHIGRSVFIGARAIILKGVEIGDQAVIGAGAVVTNNVPPSTFFAGNPARQIRSTRNTAVSARD